VYHDIVPLQHESESHYLSGSRQTYLFLMLGCHWANNRLCQWRLCTCLVAFYGRTMLLQVSIKRKDFSVCHIPSSTP